MCAAQSRSNQEVADLFNVKLQLVRDLIKDSKRKQKYFINKRKAEIRKVLQQAVIAGIVKTSLNQNKSIWNVKQI